MNCPASVRIWRTCCSTFRRPCSCTISARCKRFQRSYGTCASVCRRWFSWKALCGKSTISSMDWRWEIDECERRGFFLYENDGNVFPFVTSFGQVLHLIGTYEKVEEEEEEIYEVINVHKLKSATPNLRVINLYGINFIDDSHIDAFSSNCIQVNAFENWRGKKSTVQWLFIGVFLLLFSMLSLITCSWNVWPSITATKWQVQHWKCWFNVRSVWCVC